MLIKEDLHFHSTFSDGANTPRENIEKAIERGLERVCCVDHVRRDTSYLQEYARTVGDLRNRFDGILSIHAGVEAKLLNESGYLDMPELPEGIDFVYAADHQFPIGDGFYGPSVVRNALRRGEIERDHLVASLVNATLNTMKRHDNLVLAHLFSILPKVGLDENQVPAVYLSLIGQVARENGVAIEISERWKCPSLRAARIFVQEGVRIVYSTDAHRMEDIGQYSYAAAIAEQLRVPAIPRIKLIAA